MKLPSGHLAEIHSDKIDRYLLAEYHPQNKGKAKFYKMIGFDEKTGERLREQLLILAQHGEVVNTESTPRGTKYVVEGNIDAPNGRQYQITSVWVIQQNQNEPKLVTAYPKKL